ncbi:MAG: adenylosuccinate lyase [Peptostreptococcaceae bacterium]|nr:adenylosuccinate lyase [Peptostreptococcaceae bacterium]
MSNEIYSNPLIERYTSEEMQKIFSPYNKFRTWRTLWIALAESQKELGLDISDEQITEMKDNADVIDFEKAKEYEKKTRHDVMSHVLTFGDACPKAKAIMHLGATSAFVGDNTDLVVYFQALEIIKKKLAVLILKLSDFALEHKSLPTLGFTHYQPAQLTTVGKRAVLWIQDLHMDLMDMNYLMDNYKIRGVKGTTGTQASYLELFNGNHEKVMQLETKVAEKIGFKDAFDATGQTYSRKFDFKMLSVLSGIAQTLHKMTNDIRLLQNLKEIEEPFAKNQIGSSAMAYKRNPMRSERIASLSRYIMNNLGNASATVSTQWFERTLDDSANRRIVIPETFMATDAILDIAANISSGLVVNKNVIMSDIEKELPFMMTENILMAAVKKGGDRQELHERIRVHSMEAAKQVKQFGKKNDLLERIAKDDTFNLNLGDLKELMNPSLYIGRAPEQVTDFIKKRVNPLKESYGVFAEKEVEMKV